LKITTTTSFDENRGRWRVRLRGAGVDTKLNVPDEEFEWKGVSPNSQSERAGNVATAGAMPDGDCDVIHHFMTQPVNLSLYWLLGDERTKDADQTTAFAMCR